MTGSTDERKLQIGVSVDTTDAKKGFQDIGAAATQMGKAVASAGGQAAASTNKATDAAVQAATKQDAATKNLIQSIQRKIAVEEAGSKSSGDFYRALAGQRGIDTAQLKPYLDQLDQVTAKNRAAQEALRSTVPGFEQVGMSAKATTAALRGIPAQFTDIVTSLQGGQKPLTVLLQQGGQLKDMFGGIGPAAQALGGYILGLVNPYTLAAAAVGGLAYAYYKGSQEADEFRKSLILSGNAAGTTAATMAGYAESISKTVGTTGAAAAALAEMAASGRVAGGSLQAFSALALKMESTVGQSVSKTAEQFAELGRNPVAASEKLNEVYNYLTASVYAQIKALVEQGKATEAGALAQKSFAEALDGRMGDIKSNMGIIESGWKSITDAIKGAGDALLGVGRAQTPAEQRSILVANLQNRQDRNATLGIKDGAGTEDLRQQIAYLDESERLNRRIASSKAEQAASTRAGIDWEKEGDKYLTPRLQMERDITAARSQGVAAGKSEAEILSRISEIRKKYPTDNLDLSGQIEAVKQAERMKQEAYKQTAAVLEGEYKRGLMDEASYLLQNVTLTLESIDAQKAALQSQLALARGKKDSQKEIATLTGQIALLDAQSGTTSIKYGQAVLDMQYKRLRATQDLKEAMLEEASAAEQIAAAKASDVYMADLAGANAYKLSITDTTAQLQIEAQTLGLTNEQRALALAQLQIEINKRQQLAAIKSTDAEDKARLTQIIEDGAAQASTNAATQAALETQKTTIASIEGTAHSVWTNVMQGGQNAFQKIGQTIKAAVLDLLYQLTLKKWVISIAASVTGGVSGTASAASSGGNLLSTGSSLYSAGSNLASVGGQYLAGTMSGANAAGTVFANATGGGLDALLATNGAYGTAAEAMAGTATAAEGLTAALGSIPVYGWIALAALAAYAIFSGGGDKPSIEGGYASAGGPTGSANGRDYVNGTYGGAIDSSAKGIVDDLQARYSATVKSLGGTAGNLTAQSFIGINQGDNGNPNKLGLDAQLNGRWLYNRWTDNGGSNDAGKTTAEMQAAADLSMKKIILEALKATDMGPRLNEYLSAVVTTGKTLEEITATMADVTTIGTFNQILKSTGDTFASLTSTSAAGTLELAKVAGGIANLQTLLGTYYDLFTSAADKTANATAATSSAFAQIGVVMPEVNSGLREWYKSEVQRLGALDLSIEANAQAYAAALNLAGGVDALASSFDAAAAAKQSWQDKLDVLEGRTTDRQLALQRDLASTTDEGTKALIRRVYAEEDAAQAANAAAAAATQAASVAEAQAARSASAAEAAAAKRSSWLDRLAVLRGDTTTREIQMQADLASTTDETTQALIRLVYGMEDAQAASKALTDAYTKAIDNAKAALDRAADAERTRINAVIEQKQTALSALQSVFDLLASSTKDLYAQVDTTAAASAQQGRAYIATALALAKAGGTAPDQARLSGAITAARAGIDAGGYTSKLAQDRDRLVLAGQLSQLKDQAGVQLTAAEQALAVAKDQLTALESQVKAAQDMVDATKGVDASIISVSSALAALQSVVAAGNAYAATTAKNTYGLDTIARVKDAVKSLSWGTAASDQASASTLGAMAKAMGWTSSDIATAIGASLDQVLAGWTRYGVTGVANGTMKLSNAGLTEGIAPAATTATVPNTSASSVGSATFGGGVTMPNIAPPVINQQVQVVVADPGGTTYYTPNATQAQLDQIFQTGIGLMGGITKYDIGTNMVPRDMLAMLHEGEAVVPKAYNPALGASAPDQATADEVRALRATVSLLIDIMRDTATNTGKTKDLLTQVTEGGRAMQTEAAT